MVNKKLLLSITSIFREVSLNEKERDGLEEEIQYSAARAGFKQLEQLQDGQRIFKRNMDGATVSLPQKENLRRRDRISLHGFDGYL